jgi:hypothetical protein
VQPEDDATPSPGVRAWVTGNPRPKGNFDPDSGDVDGVATLTSPSIDATGGDNLVVEVSRWFHMAPPGAFETSHYRLEVSSDNGSTWTQLERLDGAAPAWTPVTLSIPVAPSAQMRLRVTATEERIFGGGSNLIECLIDDVTVRGHRYLCDTFSAPAADAPNPVGNTVRASRKDDSVRLDWTAPPADALHDPATTYRVHRSGAPSGGFGPAHTTTAPVHVDVGAAAGADAYYLVSAANGGGTSGEEPLP